MAIIDINEHIRRRIRVINYLNEHNGEEEYLRIEKELIALLMELKARRKADAKKD